MRVRSFDPVAFYRRDQAAIDEAIGRVLRSGRLIMGPEVRAFEEEFAAYCGVRFAAAVHSGTAALLLALRALGVGAGDEVVTVANSDVATSLAVTHAGARVVWVDIDPASFTIDPAAVAEAITPRTRAILAVHLYGIPADLDRLLAVADRHGVPVIEDACLATGATYRGRRVGGIGLLGVFSATPGKILSGVGAGGIVVTNDPRLRDRLNALRNYGKARSPYPEDWPPGPRWPSPTVELGYNERLDTVQAAVLRVSLRRLDEDLHRRREVAAAYAAAFRGTSVRTPTAPEGSQPAWHVYPVRMPSRDAVCQGLYERGIEAAIRYLPPNHLDPCYRFLGYREGDLPETERAAGEVLCLPVHPFMAPGDPEEVAAAVLDLKEGQDERPP